MSRVTLESLGCKLNQAETEALADRLVSRGHVLTGSAGEADVYVLNTCSVTHIADRKSRQALRSARRANPQARVVATGCYARRAPEELGRLGVADVILGDAEGDSLVGAIEGHGHAGSTGLTGEDTTNWGRTRSLVKIQEGCRDFCSFCVVPYTRGPGRSRTLDEILVEVKDKVARGHQEVVLTGTKIGEYRSNGHGSAGLTGLIRRILAETKVERLRLSSLQPADLTPELIMLWRHDRLCPHLHLPLQSGSDTILRQMHRPYSLAEYESAVCQARDAIPDLSITTDVLVGFPGEGEGEFEESYRFCERMGFAAIHVFPYSKRPGTSAATMPGQIDDKVKKQRSSRMMALTRRSARQFRSRFQRRTMMVLWEDDSGEGLWSGHTANYLRVYAQSDKNLANQMLAVKLVAEYADDLVGEIVNGGYDG
jgi:threonylcarbamoyladenosine tRNA methylthiotransferase MtaB